jgi:hypothetical protein
MYIKLIRYTKYSTLDFFDPLDTNKNKIKYVLFKGKHDEKVIEISDDMIDIGGLYIDCYDLTFLSR